jgi:hypothetical protein
MDKVNRVHDKETVVYTHNGVLFSQKEEWDYVFGGKWS